MRARRFVMLAMLAAIGCGDDGLVPDEVAGIYRLESIGGYHVPVALPSEQYYLAINRGDLLILPDGHFELQIAANFPALIAGTARASSGDITLAWHVASDTTQRTASGSARGDSIVLLMGSNVNQTFVFRRFARRPPVIADGMYVLASINGSPMPANISDQSNNGTRFVRRVDYDTITLRDGLFYSRERKESQISYPPAGDSAVGFTSIGTFGTFVSAGTHLVLSDAWQDDALAMPDSFTTIGGGFTVTVTQPVPYTAVYTKR